MINNSTWVANVVPGVEVILRPSVTPESTYSPSFSPLSPVPLPQPSEHSIPMPLSPQVRCLKFSEIWDAEGPYRLPFSGCGDRVFTFINGSGHANLEELNIYRRLRRRAIPERWSDLNGNLVNAGRITARQWPQINIGPVLAGRLVGLQEVGRYVVIRKAELTKTRDKGESIHLGGDPVYQWVPYPSRQHAEAGLIETFSSGYSVVGSWLELGVSRAGKVALEHFVGEKFDDDGHDIFAVVGSSRRGTQKKTEGACLDTQRTKSTFQNHLYRSLASLKDRLVRIDVGQACLSRRGRGQSK